ncbi:hypothetical protein B0I35DRAFT_440765 [Stachybotrys elegans]|uniref:Uncharacterized protein n=1 Tax=Stachybotrys elegans TaxID=80388 RepID=A0A8K0WNB6_9HYPO|nr:hypothetical protein B0I35DRAFT_440765 [Stachybotrys elegans]
MAGLMIPMVNMANGSAQQPQQQHEQPDKPLGDIFVDLQFTNSFDHLATEEAERILQEKFATQPWSFFKDAKSTYLGLRFDMRERFLKHLDQSDPATARQVRQEIERIRKARLKFNTLGEKAKLLRQLRESHQAWRVDVQTRLPTSKKEVESGYLRHREEFQRRLGELKKAERKTMRFRKDRHRIRDLALLRRIEGWDVHEEREQQRDAEPEPTQPMLAGEPTFDVNAYAIYFKSTEDGGYIGTDYQHDWLSGHFPSQKVSAHRLLRKNNAKNPLTMRAEDHLRYFHFPTNDMGWIEKAVARYYGEDDIIPDELKRRSKMNNSEKILCREFWRGQMHGQAQRVGVSSPVHARHMRARCSVIPGNSNAGPSRLNTPDPSSAERFSRSGKNVALFLPYLHWETDSRRSKMLEAIKEAEIKSKKRTKSHKHLRSVVHAARGQPKIPTRLGTYLMNLAKVADAMDYVIDEKLLKDNLYKDPPLHVRRTLDQYYFSTLDDTSERDRDQVVYRETRGSRSLHSRTARVVMVDQLWLWILDDNTIITSFPRRWGRNKPDSSGVHRCLRDYLENDGEIKSIYHLALIIVDQCSRVFFDRTKPLDQRPEVIDLFGSAIGRVTEHTTIAFHSFWRNTALHLMKSHTGPYAFNQRYMDINPEGTLLKEAHDLVEELMIMQQVFSQQLQVVKEFSRYIRQHRNHGQDEGERFFVVPGSFTGDVLPRDNDFDRATLISTKSQSIHKPADNDVQEAEMLLELIRSRLDEIHDLKDSALRTCQQLERLLSLKQQQASIVEARSALERATESVKQGRAIMAFTLVTIFFLPLGFFAGFFGMNNQTSTGDSWMSLPQQIQYMFLVSAVVIFISISIAFSEWVRVLLTLLFRIPLSLVTEYTGLRRLWKKYTIDQASLLKRKDKLLDELYKKRKENDEKWAEKKSKRKGASKQGDNGDGQDSDKAGQASDEEEQSVSYGTRHRRAFRTRGYCAEDQLPPPV